MDNSIDLPDIDEGVEQKPQYETFMTNAFPCRWAKVLTPFTDKYHKNGAYGIDLEMDGDDAKPLMEEIRNKMIAFRDEEVGRNASVSGWSNSRGFKEEKERFTFSFSQNRYAKFGTPDQSEFFVNVFGVMPDPENPTQPALWPKSLPIGNGSIVKVAYQFYPWNVPVQGGIGMSLKLKGVQVIKYIPYEAQISTYGFQPDPDAAVEMPQDAQPPENDDIPF